MATPPEISITTASHADPWNPKSDTAASDPVNGNRIRCTGREWIAANNSTGGIKTITFYPSSSLAHTVDPLTVTIASGKAYVFPPFEESIWNGGGGHDGFLFMLTSDADLKLGGSRIP